MTDQQDSPSSTTIRLKNASNKHLTKQLFHEMWVNLDSSLRSPQLPPFTLHSARKGCTNFGKVYVELEDPSGYKITQQLLGGDYRHWLNLLKCSWFQEAKELWDAELEAKLFSKGLDAVKAIAKDEEHKGRLQAAKILVDKGYAPKSANKPARGRPTTEEVSGYLKEAAHAEKVLNDDLERIRSIG